MLREHGIGGAGFDFSKSYKVAQTCAIPVDANGYVDFYNTTFAKFYVDNISSVKDEDGNHYVSSSTNIIKLDSNGNVLKKYSTYPSYVKIIGYKDGKVYVNDRSTCYVLDKNLNLLLSKTIYQDTIYIRGDLLFCMKNSTVTTYDLNINQLKVADLSGFTYDLNYGLGRNYVFDEKGGMYYITGANISYLDLNLNSRLIKTIAGDSVSLSSLMYNNGKIFINYTKKIPPNSNTLGCMCVLDTQGNILSEFNSYGGVGVPTNTSVPCKINNANFKFLSVSTDKITFTNIDNPLNSISFMVKELSIWGSYGLAKFHSINNIVLKDANSYYRIVRM